MKVKRLEGGRWYGLVRCLEAWYDPDLADAAYLSCIGTIYCVTTDGEEGTCVRYRGSSEKEAREVYERFARRPPIVTVC